MLTCLTFKGRAQRHKEGVLHQEVAHIQMQCPSKAGNFQAALRTVVEGCISNGVVHVTSEKNAKSPRAMTEEEIDSHVVGVVLTQ